MSLVLTNIPLPHLYQHLRIYCLDITYCMRAAVEVKVGYKMRSPLLYCVRYQRQILFTTLALTPQIWKMCSLADERCFLLLWRQLPFFRFLSSIWIGLTMLHLVIVNPLPPTVVANILDLLFEGTKVFNDSSANGRCGFQLLHGPLQGMGGWWNFLPPAGVFVTQLSLSTSPC